MGELFEWRRPRQRSCDSRRKKKKRERGKREKYDCPSGEFPSVFANERPRPFSAYNELSVTLLAICSVKTQSSLAVTSGTQAMIYTGVATPYWAAAIGTRPRKFPELFSLPDLRALREKCQRIVAPLPRGSPLSTLLPCDRILLQPKAVPETTKLDRRK